MPNNEPVQAMQHTHYCQAILCWNDGPSARVTPLTYISIVFCVKQWEWFHNGNNTCVLFYTTVVERSPTDLFGLTDAWSPSWRVLPVVILTKNNKEMNTNDFILYYCIRFNK